jgi:hypothetical protein
MDKLKGGLSDKITKGNIIEKYDITLAELNKQITIGVKVEMEHVDDDKMAREIAMDHLIELPDYYTRLNKMELEGKKYWSSKTKKNSTQKDAIKDKLRETFKR